MMSVVTVYNDQQALNEILVKSLKGQTAPFEFIPIDNTKNQFKSAAAALNHGASQASGKYVVFLHQDVELGSATWLEDAERTLDSLPDLGIAGVAGMGEEGTNRTSRARGYLSDSGAIWGSPVNKPLEVQILDECLLMAPKSLFARIQFDEKTFDGWHCYGADYCLSVRQMGLKAYVVPAFIYHRSLQYSYNRHDLLKYYERLYAKHRRDITHIYTMSGEMSWLTLRTFWLDMTLRPLYARLFPDWTEILKTEIQGCDTVLDLGCGYNSPIQSCRPRFSVGVEMFEPYLDESKRRRVHDQYIRADIRKIQFKPRSFEAVIAIDVLEHLNKLEGRELLDRMENWAKKKVVVLTVNGFLPQEAYDQNRLQEQRSGWTVKELSSLGFEIHGIRGWKRLRREPAQPRYRPIFLWARISDLTQKVTYYWPEVAFQLLATKEICSRHVT